MKVLICEDEKYTADRLCHLLHEYDKTIEIMAVLDSNEKAASWYKSHGMPDLVFQDIELNDGNCFQIFERVKVTAPIIFTTAYSKYALKSFSQLSIDYIVKPYDYGDIKNTLDKFKEFENIFRLPEKERLQQLLLPSVKNRLLVKTGDYYKSLLVNDIACFKSEEGFTSAYTFKKQKYLLDTPIKNLTEDLDRTIYFQINRKFILNVSAIKTIKQWFNSRLKIELSIPMDEDLIVSREKARKFKEWLNK